jgi:hypothetical protein
MSKQKKEKTMPSNYHFTMIIRSESAEQAEAVMNELCALQRIKTDLPKFTYEASWSPIPTPQALTPLPPPPAHYIPPQAPTPQAP